MPNSSHSRSNEKGPLPFFATELAAVTAYTTKSEVTLQRPDKGRRASDGREMLPDTWSDWSTVASNDASKGQLQALSLQETQRNLTIS
jgi:hypothetical protein